MTLFFISAALLVLFCLGWMLFGLFSSDGAKTDQEAVNITLARERGETLDAALADGSIDQATHDYERQQLEYDLAADLTLENNRKQSKGGQLTAAIIVGVFVPISAGALYLHLGNPGAITQDREAPAQTTANNAQPAPAFDELLPELEARLAQSPDDIEGWRLLGRTYLSINEFDKARNSLEKALALDENDAPTLAQLAEAVAMTQQGDLAGDPMNYINRARDIDPDNEHALWLQSIALQQAGEHETAMQGFDRLLGMAQGNPDAMATVEQMRAISLEALGGEESRGTTSPEMPANQPDNTSSSTAASADGQTGSQTTNQAATQSSNTQPDNTADSKTAIEVTVSLSDEARSASSDDQVVFIYATATDGPPMPLAVSRLTVSELPITITLDNSMAMIPTMTLSTFPSVTVGARVSTTGTPTAQQGDWFSEANNISPADTDALTLTIDQQSP